MFPVTDPSRADDIRMRRRRATLFLGAIGLGGFLLFGWGETTGGNRHADAGAGTEWIAEQGRLAAEQSRLMAEQSTLAAEAGRRAAEQGQRAAEEAGIAASAAASGRAATVTTQDGTARRDFPVTGTITVDVRCAGSLHLAVNDGGGDVATATAADRDGRGAEALGRLIQRDGAIIGGCERDRDVGLTVTVPRGHRLAIRQNGDLDITGDRFTDPVSVQVNGSGEVKLDATASLDADMRGSGDVLVGEIGGDLSAAIHASGDLKVAGGWIGTLRTSMDGSGDLELGGITVNDAVIRASGSGGTTVGFVRSVLDATLSGDGDLSIGTTQAASARVTLAGDGKVAINGGDIGWLDATRTGDGDMSILATVRDGTLRQSGDGTTTIPHGTLRMVPSGG